LLEAIEWTAHIGTPGAPVKRCAAVARAASPGACDPARHVVFRYYRL